MARNPFKDSKQKDRRDQRRVGLDVGVVTSVSPENHLVGVRPLTKTRGGETETKPTNASIVVDQQGDVNLPSSGDLVVIARFKNRKPILLGTYYTQKDEIPNSNVGDRILSNGPQTANITIKEDGSIHLDSDWGGVYAGNTHVTEDGVAVYDEGTYVKQDGVDVYDSGNSVANVGTGEITVYDDTTEIA